MSTFLHNCLGAGLQGEGTSYSTIDSVNTVITDLGRLLLFFSAWLLIRFILVLKIESRIYRIAGQQMFWRESCDSVFVVFWLMCCVRRIIDNLAKFSDRQVLCSRFFLHYKLR